MIVDMKTINPEINLSINCIFPIFLPPNSMYISILLLHSITKITR